MNVELHYNHQAPETAEVVDSIRITLGSMELELRQDDRGIVVTALHCGELLNVQPLASNMVVLATVRR